MEASRQAGMAEVATSVLHGFGLHGAALTAKELGGSLAVRSDGVGRGATFILELPLEQPGRNTPPVTDQARRAA